VRLTNLGLAAVMTLTMVTGASYGTAAADPLQYYREQRLNWTTCPMDGVSDSPGLQCATLAVPLNYADPGGRRIEITISRRKASDPARRRGILLVNPGGPGLSGLVMAGQYDDQEISAAYDLIGFDPRGVGHSAPVRCLRPPAILLEQPTRPSDGDIAKMMGYAHATEVGCQQVSGWLRPYVTTQNTARDLDIVRAVLGERKLNYLGISYGTYLGAVYGTLFPDRLDRSVLDSALHPTKSWYETGHDAARAEKQNLDDWAVWTAARDSEFHLGKNARAVELSVENLATKLKSGPAGAYGTVGDLDDDASLGHEFVPVDATRYPEQWAALAQSIANALTDVRDQPHASIPSGASVAEPPAPEPVENGHDAIMCDWSWPSDPAVYERNLRYYRSAVPYGNTASLAGSFAPNNCSFRSDPRAEPMPVLTRTGYPAGMIVHGERDTTTPYTNGVAMARALHEPLLTVRDNGNHGHYGVDQCVTEAVNRYLVDGLLPKDNDQC
jgi:pimeloyl-ACP methyl ester carboxylesterase